MIYIYYILNIYFYLLIIYVLLGWIDEVRRSRFYYYYGLITEPFLKIFRGFIVVGNLDFTPMVGLILYQVLLNYLLKVI